MSKVAFTHKSGRVEQMHPRYADVLQKLGRGTYITRDMRAVTTSAVVVQAPAPVPAPIAEPEKPQAADDKLDTLSAESLRKLAEERGVQVHHRAGAEKVREALRDAK